MEPTEEIRYDANMDYNQFIDDEHGEVTVGTESFLPSEILYNLKREAYRIGLDDYRTQKREELKDLVFSEFPSNIAYYFRLSEKGENANNPVIRFLHLKDTWEGIIFILNALVWGEVRAKGIDLKTAHMFHSGVATNHFNSRVLLSDELKQILENIKAVIVYAVANGITMKCAEYISSYAQKCRFQTFQTHSLNREFIELTVEGDKLAHVIQNGQSVVMAKWEDDIFSLSPFLHFIPDNSGFESFLCVYKGKRDGKFLYEPVKQRHNISFDALQHRFDAEKQELQNLIVP